MYNCDFSRSRQPDTCCSLLSCQNLSLLHSGPQEVHSKTMKACRPDQLQAPPCFSLMAMSLHALLSTAPLGAPKYLLVLSCSWEAHSQGKAQHLLHLPGRRHGWGAAGGNRTLVSTDALPRLPVMVAMRPLLASTQLAQMLNKWDVERDLLMCPYLIVYTYVGTVLS